MSLKRGYWTVVDLLEEDGRNKDEVKRERDELVRKFREILEKLGFQEEMINWYRSSQVRISSGKSKGYFIFAGEDVSEVRINLENLFGLDKEMEKESSYENMIRIIDILQNLLPWTKDEYLMKAQSEDQIKEVRKLFCLIDQIKELKMFDSCKGKPRSRNELDKVWRYIGKIDESRFELYSGQKSGGNEKEVGNKSDEESIDNKAWNTYQEHKKTIERIVIDCFLDRMNGQYVKRLFSKDTRKAVYINLYEKLSKWYIKWLSLFDTIDELRKVEDIFNTWEFLERYEKDQEYVEKFFRRGTAFKGEVKEAYDCFPKLPIQFFSKYYENNFDDKCLRAMIRKASTKELLEVIENDRWRKEDYIYACNMIVENIGLFKHKRNKDDDVVDMKVEALYELNMITKSIQGDISISAGESWEGDLTDAAYREDKEKLRDYYSKRYHKKIRKEYLDCIFYLKHIRKKTVLDYMPYRELLYPSK
ncbi:MAG: hypothetical protein HDR05_05375 [Lachnospiraceae bacterium]|nr:hypothetical protein [Lachnospiraceae bacterium]